MSLGSGGSAWQRSPPVPAHAGLVWGWGGQKNLVWPEVRFLCWDALFLACLRCSRCCSAQVSHLIWPWMVRAQQSTHSPRALASFRLAWVWWRCSSLRSGVLFLFRSYSCRFSFLASTSAGVGSGQRFGVAFLRGLLMVGFRFSFRDFFSLAWGPPPAFCGLGNVKVNSKVRPTARGSGACAQWVCSGNFHRGLFPSARGLCKRRSWIGSPGSIASLIGGGCKLDGPI